MAAVEGLYGEFARQYDMAKALGGDAAKRAKYAFKHIFLENAVPFAAITLRFFFFEYEEYEAFVVARSNKTSEEMLIDPDPFGEQPPVPDERCPVAMSDSPSLSQAVAAIGEAASRASDMLLGLGWEGYVEDACNAILYKLIDQKIVSCAAMHDRPLLARILLWFERVVLRWLARILEKDEALREDDEAARTQLFE